MIKNFKKVSFFFFIISLLTFSVVTPLPDAYFSDEESFSAVGDPLGQWNLLHKSVGISAMHMQLLHDDHIVIFDRTDFGPSNLTLPAGKCITSSAVDCTAHSLLYDVASNTFRPLTVLSDTWCSSGSVDPAGKLIQTGGYALGERVIRTFTPCSRPDDYLCDWEELPVSLSSRRWYASNLLLPDGRVIIVGGRGSHNYEFFPKSATSAGRYPLQFLADTWDGRNKENNLYPFLHLLPNGHIFIFANNKSIEFDYVAGKVVRKFPIMPFRERRNYPSTGSSVLLPISETDTSASSLEILICGGASPESFDLADKEKVYVAASTSCGRMKITDPNPQWIMENMPTSRVMPDMVMLPTGDVLIINGAANGTAGWENADNPVLNPILYRTYDSSSRRFTVLNPTRIPRLYHSSAVLVSDGRVIVGGSNPHPNYNFTAAAKFPTELSLEAFSPPYLDQRYAVLRPSILAVETESMVVTYGQIVSVTYVLGMYKQELGVKVTMLLPPFTTHSFGMNQRLVVLAEENVNQLSTYAYKVTVKVPLNVNVAPPGLYLLFVVHAGVPSHGVWVQLKRPNS